MRLRISSASTVERRAREVSRRRSRSTSRATAEAASSMAVTALRRVSRSLSSMHGILPEAVPLVVALGDEVGVHGRPEAHDGHQDPTDQDDRERRVDELEDYEDDAFAYLPVVDLPQPCHDNAEDGRQYGIAHEPLLFALCFGDVYARDRYSFRRRCSSLSLRYSSSSAAAPHFSRKTSAARSPSAPWHPP